MQHRRETGRWWSSSVGKTRSISSSSDVIFEDAHVARGLRITLEEEESMISIGSAASHARAPRHARESEETMMNGVRVPELEKSARLAVRLGVERLLFVHVHVLF